MDTIFALATSPGKAGVAIVRLSGPQALAAAERLVGVLPVHGRTLRKLRNQQGEILDEALVLTFAAGRSYTLEPVVEFHLHGSRAVTNAVLAVLGRNEGLRGAEAGEFTRRAFEGGRLDLAQVEGLADLIDAETEGQLRQAQRELSGALARRADGWRVALLRAGALVEATIDFVDEDVPVQVLPEVRTILAATLAELRAESAGSRMAERVRDGFEVAIVGAPNVGKSTLLNRLAGRDAAITSVFPGTTRDIVEVRMDLDGLPVILLDTAGLREALDEVEHIGIERARLRAAAADLRVHLVLPGQPLVLPVVAGDIIAVAQADLVVNGATLPDRLPVSGLTGQGLQELVAAISCRLSDKVAVVGVAVRERHRVAIDSAAMHLSEALVLLEATSPPIEILAHSLRAAMHALDVLVGRIDVEDILGEIFASFCIGK